MRRRLIIPRERLVCVLGRLGPSSAPALEEVLAVPRTTLLRLLAEQQHALVLAGDARRRRYAARRGLRGDAQGVAVYRIDPLGQAHAAGALHLVQPQGSFWPLDGALWPVPEAARDGWWGGLPYPVQEMRVQGYMGRQFAQRHHDELNLPPDPRDWTDDDHLIALLRAGHDAPGDLILGDAGLRRWQTEAASRPALIAEAACARAYAALAERAVVTGVIGSSAAGEFPKFTARRTLTGALTPEVIVKFSGADHSAAVRRWADLLTCEHLALQALATEPGLPVARSRVLRHAGRTFLESERFDRHGEHGRSPVISLNTLDAEALGQGHSHWPRLAQALVSLGWLGAADAQRIGVIHWFGRLIANTDMHTGNLSFVPEAGRLRLAPVYDMLPMRLAPLAGSEVPPLQAPDLPLPLSVERDTWQAAAALAGRFWVLVSHERRLSAPMRALGHEQARRLQLLAP